MKSAKTRSAGRSKKTSAPIKKRKALDLTELREEITTIVKSRAVSMVDTTIGEADKGHFAAMKYLFEMIGLYPPPAGEEEPVGESVLAKTLIRRLGLPEQPVLPSPGLMSESAEKTSETSAQASSSLATASSQITKANNLDAVANAVE